MNIIGKIFVFAVFIMSLVFMSFAVAIYSSHINWEQEVNRKAEDVQGGQQLGLKFQLEEAQKERKKLEEQISTLVQKVAASEAARDQVVAKLRTALEEKNEELGRLAKEKETREEAQQKAIAELEMAEANLKKAVDEVAGLREQVRQQQAKVDKAAELAQKLHESQSFLEIANERKEQLEKQVANARLLLKQQGLSLDALPKDRVPTLDGDVLAVADNAIEVSLGGDEGLQAGHTLEVYRDGQYVGRAVVKTVKPDRAVAVILREYSRGIVQRGDKVTTRLKG
jgi:hypothetical protein